MPAPASALARKRQATCDAILDATSGLIAEKGADGFTISEVAERGRINRALIYHYFRNRDNLILEAIRHVVDRYEGIRPSEGSEAIARSTRMLIEHPEVGRFFYQMLLGGQPLPGLSTRIFQAVEDLETVRRAQAPESGLDPTFTILSAALLELAWSFARTEIARYLDISLEEADRRFIDHMKRNAAVGMMTPGRATGERVDGASPGA
jgi:AcrR family transcriptional regulator